MQITDIIAKCLDEKILNYFDHLVDFTNSDFLYEISILKNQRKNILRSHFLNHDFKRIYVSNNLRNAVSSPFNYKYDLQVLPKNFLKHINELEEMHFDFEDSIVVINNNDLSDISLFHNFINFYHANLTTCFVVWDWDNHHWLNLSILTALFSDIYCPSHNENMVLFSKLNAHTFGPVFCSTVQWSRDFLNSHSKTIFQLNRNNAPLGQHIPYPKFQYRNRVVMTLSQKFPSVNFSAPHYAQLSDLQRLEEWAGHKCHWIIPVLNDIPIRIFDALITGGIPIVPSSLRGLEPIRNINPKFIEFYDALDVVEPEQVVARAVKKFDDGGLASIHERYDFAIQNHHFDQSLSDMCSFIAQVYQAE